MTTTGLVAGVDTELSSGFDRFRVSAGCGRPVGDASIEH
jgi:hypothetical protein